MLSFKDFLVAQLFGIIEQHWPLVLPDPYGEPGETQADPSSVGLEGVEEPVEPVLEDGDVDTEGVEALAPVLGLGDEDQVEPTPQDLPDYPEVIETLTLPAHLALPVEPPHDSQVPEDTMDLQEAAAPTDGGPGVPEVVGGLDDAPDSPSKPPQPSPTSSSVPPTELELSPSPAAVHTAEVNTVVQIEDSPEPPKNKPHNLEDVNAKIEALRILVCIVADVCFCFIDLRELV